MPTVNYDMSSSIPLNGNRNQLSEEPVDDGLTDEERYDVNLGRSDMINSGVDSLLKV